MDTAASVGFSFQTTGTDGYAIPINSAVAIAKKIESGHSSASVHIGPTGFLGVQVESSQSGSSPSGAVIHEVLPGSPAASAGLVAGDVITSLGGAAVHSAPGAHVVDAAVPPRRPCEGRLDRFHRGPAQLRPCGLPLALLAESRARRSRLRTQVPVAGGQEGFGRTSVCAVALA